jgi:hypothetical protein
MIFPWATSVIANDMAQPLLEGAGLDFLVRGKSNFRSAAGLMQLARELAANSFVKNERSQSL